MCSNKPLLNILLCILIQTSGRLGVLSCSPPWLPLGIGSGKQKVSLASLLLFFLFLPPQRSSPLPSTGAMRGPGTQWLTEASSPSCVLLKADRPLDHSTHSSLCVFVQGEFAQKWHQQNEEGGAWMGVSIVERVRQGLTLGKPG